uniref:Uncharacterized protein n=1 Tax=Rhizophora mucronata TaxID=61149 RepID=A0A2P2QBR5_RHIMU
MDNKRNFYFDFLGTCIFVRS